jgi:hypothetical protein
MADIDKGGGAPAKSLDELRTQENDLDVDDKSEVDTIW